MKAVLVFLIALLSACNGPPMTKQQIDRAMLLTARGTPDESLRWDGEPAHWGQRKKYWDAAAAPQQEKVSWAPGIDFAKVVLEVPAPNVFRVPQVQTLMLGANLIIQDANSFLPRWKLEVGVGGGRVTFLIDAQKLQQVTLPAAATRASFYLDPQTVGAAGTAFNATGLIADLVGYEADGNTPTSPAQYTQIIIVNDGTTGAFVIPAGATRVRVVGGDALASLGIFNVNAEYDFMQGSTLVDQYTGPNMLALHTAGDFLPIPAACNKINVVNATGAQFTGYLLYELEL